MTHYHIEREARWSLIGPGLIVFGLAYVGGVGVAADYELRGGSANLLIPVAGPMIVAANIRKYECGFTPPANQLDCNNSGFFMLLVADSIMQVTGVGLIASGVLFRRKIWVRNPGFTFAPTIRVANGPQLGISGTF